MGFLDNIGAKITTWTPKRSSAPGLIYKKKSGILYEIVEVDQNKDNGVWVAGRCSKCCFNMSCGYPNTDKYVPPCKKQYGRTDGKVVYFKRIDNKIKK